MPNNRTEDRLRLLLSQAEETNVAMEAPSRLKARIYSALIHEQQQGGALQSLSASEAAGRGLCIFEKLVQISPVGEQAETPFFCWICHARILAEKIEAAPIYWQNCPYVNFQKR